jgi:hypothetical protein
MASIRINQLPSGATLTDDDVFLIMDDPSGTAITKRVSASVLRSSVLNQAAQLQLRQGTNVERGLITPASGEPIWVTDQKKLYIGDGTTVGGQFIGPYIETGTDLVGRDSAQSAIAGGQKNQIISTYGVTVGAGYYNVAKSAYSTIGGGYYNESSIASTKGTIAGGEWNTVVGSHSTIGGGGGNTTNGMLSTIGGGGSLAGENRNIGNITNGYASTICGGVGNNSLGDYSTVIGGYAGKSTLYGQVSHAAGSFATQGDAQHSILMARRATSDATANSINIRWWYTGVNQ